MRTTAVMAKSVAIKIDFLGPLLKNKIIVKLYKTFLRNDHDEFLIY